MSNLYRCKARVAYRPIRSDFAIVFEERQINSIEAGLALNMSNLVLNDKNPVKNMFATDQNTCKVVINDPYLDGLAWASLGEIDRAYKSLALQGIKSGDLLPMCETGQTPEKDKCRRYAVLDAKAEGINPENAFPWIIITLWYTLGGGLNQTIEQTYYYRATGVNITHGISGEPTVSITGKHAMHVAFQQNLQPTFFQKGKGLVDEFNAKTDIKQEGYKLEDICATGADTYKVDRNYRINNLTTEELLEKWVKTIDGSQVLSLPTKEFANKIQLCSRSDTGCYLQRVFFLGKGLYEKYTIDSKFENSDLLRNLKAGGGASEADRDSSSGDGLASIEPGKTYDSYRGDPNVTSQKLRAVNSEAWTTDGKQFTDVGDYNGGDSTNGYKGTGTPSTGQPPNITAGTFKIEKIENQLLFKTASNANNYLGGRVVESGDGRVLIESEYHIHYCVPESKKCATSMVMQEYKNLEKIDFKTEPNQDGIELLAPGASVGTVSSDPQNESKTRFLIKIGRDSNIKEITLDPTTLQGLISCTEPPSDEDQKEKAPSTSTEGRTIENKIGEIGSTGASSGPHIHAMWWTQGRSAQKPITQADVERYVDIAGSVTMTSAYGAQESFRSGPHDGIDLAGAEGIELFVKGGAKILDADRGVINPEGYGYSVVIDTPEGGMLLGHLKAGSIPSGIPDTSGASGSVRVKGSEGEATASGASSGIVKEGITLRTQFKGVPKALSVLPGRTVLSFVTDYDNWIKNGKPNTIEPGVWIPEKYRTWAVVKTIFKWEQGDLKVEVEGRRPFKANELTEIDRSVPRWEAHRAEKGYKDYYDYIRSAGDLCFGDSCTKCSGVPIDNSGNATNGSSTSPTNVATNYPRGKFTYTCNQYNQSKVQALLDAGSALGVTNKAGLAAIVSGDPGENSTGIFQWNPDVGRLQALQKWAGDQGLDWRSYSTQVNYFVYDVKKSYPGLVPALNSASSPFGAANAFDRNYTISGDRDAGPNSRNNQKRTQYVNDILKCMSES